MPSLPSLELIQWRTKSDQQLDSSLNCELDDLQMAPADEKIPIEHSFLESHTFVLYSHSFQKALLIPYDPQQELTQPVNISQKLSLTNYSHIQLVSFPITFRFGEPTAGAHLGSWGLSSRVLVKLWKMIHDYNFSCIIKVKGFSSLHDCN